jgi:hypothetical protein
LIKLDVSSPALLLSGGEQKSLEEALTLGRGFFIRNENPSRAIPKEALLQRAAPFYKAVPQITSTHCLDD